MLKRIISMAVVVMMVMSMFVACSGKEKEQETTTGSDNNAPTVAATDEAAPTEAAQPEEVELTMWVTEAQQNDFALEQEKRFNEKYPYIKLNKILVNEGMDYMSAYAAGNAPDFLGVGMPQISSYIYAGVAAPLDEYLDNWDEKPNMRMESFDNFAVNGKHYGIPDDSYVMVLNYNKKIFAEAGLQPPTTWDELLETAKTLTKPDQNQWGMNLLIAEWTEWWFEYFVWQAGGDLTAQNEDGTLKLTFTDPAVQKALEFYRSLIDAKCIQPDITMNYEAMQKEFAAGHAAMTINGSDAIGFYVSNGMNPEDVGYAPLPVGPSGNAVTQTGGAVTFITSGLPKEVQDAAWAWLSFTNSKEEKAAYYEYRLSQGSLNPSLKVRNDMGDFEKEVAPDLQAIFDQAASNARLEFYGKGVVGSYVDRAVQSAALDPSIDILKVFQEQQDLAQKEAADQFNQSVLDSKQ